LLFIAPLGIQVIPKKLPSFAYLKTQSLGGNWQNRYLEQEEFLTNQTAQGLRVTSNSTIDLSKYLLEKCGYDYVLTGKMCQDPLEVSIPI